MYEAFQRGDINAVLQRMDENISFRIPGGAEVPTAGNWRGRKDMERFFETLGATVDFTRFEPREYVAQGDRVIALGHYESRVKVTGKTLATDWVMAWTIRNGKAVDFQEYMDTEAGVQAFRGERGMRA
jgi:ketosteroid isomerase-like protein